MSKTEGWWLQLTICTRDQLWVANTYGPPEVRAVLCSVALSHAGGENGASSTITERALLPRFVQWIKWRTVTRGKSIISKYCWVLLLRGSIYHDITFSIAMTMAEHKSDFKLTTDTPSYTTAISPWIKSISNELDITIHMISSQLSCHCDVISNQLWRHQQNENWASETRGRCVKIVVFIIIYGFIMSCKKLNNVCTLMINCFCAHSSVILVFISLVDNPGNKHQNNLSWAVKHFVTQVHTLSSIYFNFMGELWGVFDEGFGERYPCNNSTIVLWYCS